MNCCSSFLSCWYKQTRLMSHLWQSRQSVVMQAGQLRTASLLGKPWAWRGCDRDAAAGRLLQAYLHRKTREKTEFWSWWSCLSLNHSDFLRVSYRLLVASTQAWSLSSSSGSYRSSSLVGMVRCFRLRPVELPAEKAERNKSSLNLGKWCKLLHRQLRPWWHVYVTVKIFMLTWRVLLLRVRVKVHFIVHPGVRKSRNGSSSSTTRNSTSAPCSFCWEIIPQTSGLPS